MDGRIINILSFWFAEENSKLWFISTDEFDAKITDQYENIWNQAAKGKLDDWKTTADGALALVIVLDQFPLNMYRNQAKRYSSEAKAREISSYAIAHNLHQKIDKNRLSFLFLPFMHSENIKDQEYSIELFQANGLDDNYAKHHHDIVQRFGRFPHRNVDLGRESTAEEIEHLKHTDW